MYSDFRPDIDWSIPFYFGQSVILGLWHTLHILQGVFMYVLDPPVVDVSPSNITTNESREVMIYCTYEANPTRLNAVRW